MNNIKTEYENDNTHIQNSYVAVANRFASYDIYNDDHIA